MLTRRPPLIAGIVAAALGVALTTLLVYALKDVAPVLSLGVVYLLVVLVVATVWGAWLALGDRGRERARVQLLPHPADRALHDRQRRELGRAGRVLPRRGGGELAGADRAQAGAGGRRAPPGGRPVGRDGAAAAARRAAGGDAAGGRRAARPGARPGQRGDRAARGRGGGAQRRLPAARRHAPDRHARAPGGRAGDRAPARAGPRRAVAGGAAGRRAGTRRAAVRGGRDRRAAPQRRDQDRAAALGLARPALAADRDPHQRRGAALAEPDRRRARRARRGRRRRGAAASRG